MSNEIKDPKEGTMSTPYPVQQAPTSIQAQTESAKAVEEVQAALVIAKRFPRDEAAAFNKIISACRRQSLAEQALYAYKRGNETVTGPSIRLAEVMAQSWGNISFGVRELEQRDGASLAQAFAWDMETNTKQVKEFSVPHKRYTKSGTYSLTDPRDIYEMVANNGARRMRACILGIIPIDVVEAAVAEVTRTMEGGAQPTAERIATMIEAFGAIGVTKEMVKKHLGHNIEATTAPEIVKLQAVYKSIRDGFAKASAYFDTGEAEPGDKAAAVSGIINNSGGNEHADSHAADR